MPGREWKFGWLCITQTIFNFVNIIVGIAMIAVGTTFDEADKQEVATFFLKVKGSILLVSTALKLPLSRDYDGRHIVPCFDLLGGMPEADYVLYTPRI